MKGNPIGPVSIASDSDLVLVRRWMRAAIDESRWKHEAVAMAMTEAGVPTDGVYLSKLLSGEKPISAKHLRALPDDIEAIYARLQAEHFGHIVVTPVTGDRALRNLVSGLIGVMAPLPARADAMAKAQLPAAGDAARKAWVTRRARQAGGG